MDRRIAWPFFLRDAPRSVIYSPTTMVARVSQPDILTSYAMHQHTQSMTGSPLDSWQRRLDDGEDDRRGSLGTNAQGRRGRVYLWDLCRLPSPVDSGSDSIRDENCDREG